MRKDCNFQVASGSQDSWPRFEERLSTVCPEGNPGVCSLPHRRKVSGFTRLLLVMPRGVSRHSMVDHDRRIISSRPTQRGTNIKQSHRRPLPGWSEHSRNCEKPGSTKRMMYQSPEEAVADSVGSIWGCYGYRDLVREKKLMESGRPFSVGIKVPHHIRPGF